jgi:hypothetical protein
MMTGPVVLVSSQTVCHSESVVITAIGCVVVGSVGPAGVNGIRAASIAAFFSAQILLALASIARRCFSSLGRIL